MQEENQNTNTSVNPTNNLPPQTNGMVNGQPFQQTPLQGNQSEQPIENRSSKKHYVFIVLGILQALGVALFFLTMLSIAGKTGSEFIAIALFITLIPATGLIALINLIGLSSYLAKYKPKGKGLVFGIISLIISLILVLCGAFAVYQFRVGIPKSIDKLSKQVDEKSKARAEQFAASNAKPEITKDEAIAMLKACQLKGFYYTDQNDKDNGGWGNISSTGVVLTKVDNKPYRISIADRLIPEIVPIAREAQKTCGDPQFWHDGTYEQYKNGHWYFNNTIVN